MIVELKSHPEVLRVIRAVSPSYRKAKAIIVTAERVELNGTYWDGGSRSSYCGVDLASMREVGNGAPQYAPPQFGGPRITPTVELPEGRAIVKLGTFQGKTATATVYINPANMAKLLPA